MICRRRDRGDYEKENKNRRGADPCSNNCFIGVETDEKCSLTFTLDDTEFDELRSLEIPVDVYKVADITEEAVYDTAKYTDFDDLGLEKVSSTTTAEEWAQMAEDAMKIVEDKKIAPTADVKVTKPV